MHGIHLSLKILTPPPNQNVASVSLLDGNFMLNKKKNRGNLNRVVITKSVCRNAFENGHGCPDIQ